MAGCATPGYNPPRVESELEHAGATAAQARCVTKGLSANFDQTQLGSHSEPSLARPKPQPSDPPRTKYQNEFEITRDILKTCKVTLPLNPLPS